MWTAALALLSLQTGTPAPAPKALVVFIDGFLPGVLVPEVMPNAHRLLEEGAWSLRARCEDTTISGSGWSTFLTGVHRDKHGVPDNAFAAPHYDRYPHLFARLREARPGTICASANSWKPIQDMLIAPSAPDYAFYAEYDLSSDDYFDADSVDALCADATAAFLAQPRADCVVVMFDESDGTGHSEGNAHYDADDELYRAQLARIDAHIGRLLAVIEERPSRARESWLVAIHADHAGQQHEGHGQNKPSHREAPFLLHGPGIARGEIWPPPKSPDLVASVLHHFGIEPRAEWELDGTAVGVELAPPAEPGAAWRGPALALFGRNLLLNPGAELERAFDANDPDASLAGWIDEGWLTAVRYGAPDGFPGPGDPGPPERGLAYYSGGRAAERSEIRQRVDLRALVPWIARGGVRFELSGWLGGYLDQEDRAELSVRFFDRSEGLLEESTPLTTGAAEREGHTGLWHRSGDGHVPPATWSCEVVLHALPGTGQNDGYADELALVLLPREGERAPQWVELFDGSSLAGWVPVNVAADTFTVRDGELVCDGVPTGVLRSVRRYENYVLELDYRHVTTGGNAGLFLWSDPLPAVGQPFTRAIEVQVIDGWESANWTSHGDVFAIWGATMTPDREHPAGWLRCLPEQRRANGTGEWNRFRVVAVDGTVQLSVNGLPVSGGTGVAPREGYICLESEGAPVHFRYLRLLELPSTLDLAPAPAEDAPPLRAAAERGFTSLYSGRDLRGWREPERGWRAADWRLVAEAGAPPLVGVAALGDFELRLDVRVTGDSGAPPEAHPGAVPLELLDLGADRGWHRVELRRVAGVWDDVRIDGRPVRLPERSGTPAPSAPLVLAAPGAAACEFANLFARTLP